MIPARIDRESRRLPIGSLMAIGAAVLAAIPLILSSLDGNRDKDPFFLVLVAAAVAVAALSAPAVTSRPARMISRLLALAWLGTAAWAAFLLIWFQTACGCSSPDPSSLPPTPTYLGLPATAFHLLATYGGGLLVSVAAFGRSRSRPASR